MSPAPVSPGPASPGPATTSSAELLHELREAYDVAGAGWASGPTVLYGRLADAMVAESPIDLGGRRILDAGAGTGAVSSALLRVGARPVQADLAVGMLDQCRDLGLPAIAADVSHLPLRRDAVDGAVAGFCLNHVRDPTAGLAELGRVTVPGGPILVTTFAEQPRHPAKEAVDRIASVHGFLPPPWYTDLKTAIEPQLASAAAMAGHLTAAGLRSPRALERDVDAGIDTARGLADYRLGMAHLAPFLASLPPEERASVDREVLDALDGMPPLHPRIVIGVATA